jgi:long-chain acyl-CoA synthetase
VNLAGILTASAELFGANTALKLDERELTYWALDLASARLAGLLMARGLLPGQRVGVMLPNVPQLAVAHYGVLRAGAAVVPIGLTLERHEVAFRLNESDAGHLLAWHGVAETADAAARQAGADCLFVTPGEFEKLLLTAQGEHEPFECAPADTAMLFDGQAELSHERLVRDARDLVARLGLTDEDVTLSALSSFELLHATVAAGACMTLIERFDPARALAVIERDRVTVFQGARLLRDPDRPLYS